MSQKDVKILGTKIDITSMPQVLSFVRARLGKKGRKDKFYIVTPNPEIVLKAKADNNYRKILNSADLSLPDGYGLVIAGKMLGLQGPNKVVHGRTAFWELVRMAGKKGWKLFLLGDNIGRGSAVEAMDKLRLNFKNLKMEAAAGPDLNSSAAPVTEKDKEVEKDIVKRINDFKPDLLFVGFGAPKQEKWIHTWLPRLEITGAMAVGGTFDYVIGRAKLPPRWVSEMHLEWLWRLFTQPKRAVRIFNATFRFMFEIVKQLLA